MSRNWIAAALIGLAIALAGALMPAAAVADSSWDSAPAQVSSQAAPTGATPLDSPWD